MVPSRFAPENDGLQTSNIENELNHCTVLFVNDVKLVQIALSKACDKTNHVVMGSTECVKPSLR